MIVAPVFAIIMLGYLALRLQIVNEYMGDGLSAFVFAIAVPALLFRSLVMAQLPDTYPWTYWLAYFSAVAIVWSISSLISRRLYKRSAAEAAILGFAAAQANTVLVGIPLIMRAFGETASVPLVMMLAIHLPLTMSAATVQLEHGLGRSGTGRTIIVRLVRHPILISIALAMLARSLHLELDEISLATLKLLGDAAAPCALFATGIALRRYGLGRSPGLVFCVSALKLVLHPLLVYVFGKYVFALQPLWLGVAVLFAACPTGINAYLMAQQYKISHAETSGAIALTTSLSVVTLLLWVSLVIL